MLHYYSWLASLGQTRKQNSLEQSESQHQPSTEENSFETEKAKLQTTGLPVRKRRIRGQSDSLNRGGPALCIRCKIHGNAIPVNRHFNCPYAGCICPGCRRHRQFLDRTNRKRRMREHMERHAAKKNAENGILESTVQKTTNEILISQPTSQTALPDISPSTMTTQAITPTVPYIATPLQNLRDQADLAGARQRIIFFPTLPVFTTLAATNLKEATTALQCLQSIVEKATAAELKFSRSGKSEKRSESCKPKKTKEESIPAETILTNANHSIFVDDDDVMDKCEFVDNCSESPVAMDDDPEIQVTKVVIHNYPLKSTSSNFLHEKARLNQVVERIKDVSRCHSIAKKNSAREACRNSRNEDAILQSQSSESGNDKLQNGIPESLAKNVISHSPTSSTVTIVPSSIDAGIPVTGMSAQCVALSSCIRMPQVAAPLPNGAKPPRRIRTPDPPLYHNILIAVHCVRRATALRNIILRARPTTQTQCAIHNLLVAEKFSANNLRSDLLILKRAFEEAANVEQILHTQPADYAMFIFSIFPSTSPLYRIQVSERQICALCLVNVHATFRNLDCLTLDVNASHVARGFDLSHEIDEFLTRCRTSGEHVNCTMCQRQAAPTQCRIIMHTPSAHRYLFVRLQHHSRAAAIRIQKQTLQTKELEMFSNVESMTSDAFQETTIDIVDVRGAKYWLIVAIADRCQYIRRSRSAIFLRNSLSPSINDWNAIDGSGNQVENVRLPKIVDGLRLLCFEPVYESQQ